MPRQVTTIANAKVIPPSPVTFQIPVTVMILSIRVAGTAGSRSVSLLLKSYYSEYTLIEVCYNVYMPI